MIHVTIAITVASFFVMCGLISIGRGLDGIQSLADAISHVTRVGEVEIENDGANRSWKITIKKRY